MHMAPMWCLVDLLSPPRAGLRVPAELASLRSALLALALAAAAGHLVAVAGRLVAAAVAARRAATSGRISWRSGVSSLYELEGSALPPRQPSPVLPGPRACPRGSLGGGYLVLQPPPVLSRMRVHAQPPSTLACVLLHRVAHAWPLPVVTNE